MKKLIVMIAALTAALFIVGCASTGPSASEMMSSAKNSTPPGTLVGQGTAKESSKDASTKKSQDNARFQLVRAMSFIVKDLVDDSVASGRLSSGVAEDFRQGINTALSRSILSNAVKQDQGFGAGDTAWTVLYMEKADVLKEINSAVNIAKQNFAAGNFNTDGFDAKYNTYSAREWKN
jgi:hypothetical protein